MKVKDLKPDADLLNVPLRLPDEALKAFKDFGGGEPVMYCVGPVMGYGFMMSPEPPGTEGKRRLYPLPESLNMEDILEWEIEDGKPAG